MIIKIAKRVDRKNQMWYNKKSQTKQNKENLIPRGYYTLFWLSSDMSSVKTRLHSDGNKVFLFYLGFVWRQSELRFSVR